jgi:hypothetical protein
MPKDWSCLLLWRFPMQKYDRSLMEVWEWKDKVYQELKNLTPEERVEKLRKDTDKLLREHGIKLKRHYMKKSLKTSR